MRRLFIVLLSLACATPLVAQEDTTRIPTGVRLGMIYQTLRRPALAVRPFAAGAGMEAAAEAIGTIVRRDLDYSDRFEMAATPPQLAEGPMDYATWNGLGVVYVVTGSVEPLEEGRHLLRLGLHDVVYGNLKEIRAFELPPADAPGFRMAVHAAADEVVRWATGQPGMAASRVVFVRRNADGTAELMAVDSDGDNLQRLARSDSPMMSPALSPDARRVAYSVERPGGWHLHERELETGEVRVIAARRDLNMTPSYSPDGRSLAFAMWTGAATDLYAYDVTQDCCLRLIRSGPGEDMMPSYSPDGRQVTFMSDRLGQPHVYVMSAEGGEATLLSPYTYGEPGYYTSPDWAPESSLIIFHGRSRGQFQLMVADAASPGSTVRQVTEEGSSEDPSWAPDGRHVVFVGVRAGGRGLYVMDTVSGRTRPLVLGGRLRLPDWSSALVRASALTVRDR